MEHEQIEDVNPKPNETESDREDHRQNVKQNDSGLLCLCMLASYHGMAADVAKLQHELGGQAFSTQTILLAAKSLGMKAQEVTQPLERLDKAPLPVIALDKDGKFFILAKYDGGTARGSAAGPTAGPDAPADAPPPSSPTVRLLILETAVHDLQ